METSPINEDLLTVEVERIQERLLDTRNPKTIQKLAEQLLFLALKLQGVDCPACHGIGHRDYQHSSTWRHGVGVDGVNVDICDVCWGTGRNDRNGVNLRELYEKQERLRRESSRRWLEQRVGAQYELCRRFLPVLATKLRHMRFQGDGAFWSSQAANNVAEVLEEMARDFEQKDL